MKYFCGLIVFVLQLTACSLFSKSDDKVAPATDPKVTKRFEVGLKKLEQEKYAEAAKIFDDILVENPTTELDLIVSFNAGAAYEGLGRCQQAAERYRSVVKSTLTRQGRIYAQALFRLSYVYECLGDNPKVIATLLDLHRRDSFLDENVKLAEVPARLAAAYARVGNRTTAEKYFKLASEGIQRLNIKFKNQSNQTVTLVQTLYLMGRFNQKELLALGDGLEMVQSISFLQPYLLQAVEMNVNPWSEKSAQDILLAYDHIYKILQSPQPESDEDSLIAERNQKSKQRQLAKSALASLRSFKAIKMPKEPTALVAKLMQDLNQRERLYQTTLADLSVGNPLTPEAESVEGLKRQGQTKGSATVLEKKKKSVK